jgi:predicted HicB family RNase H-like nuclease
MARLLEYKGYYGSIDVSPEDNCLFGKLEFINALVSYEAETVRALETAFHEAVDDYLADCAKKGYEPEIPCKGSFNVRVGHEAHLRAAVAARERGMSLNDFTRQAIETFIGTDLVTTAQRPLAAKRVKNTSINTVTKPPRKKIKPAPPAVRGKRRA